MGYGTLERTDCWWESVWHRARMILVSDFQQRSVCFVRYIIMHVRARLLRDYCHRLIGCFSIEYSAYTSNSGGLNFELPRYSVGVLIE